MYTNNPLDPNNQQYVAPNNGPYPPSPQVKPTAVVPLENMCRNNALTLDLVSMAHYSTLVSIPQGRELILPFQSAGFQQSILNDGRKKSQPEPISEEIINACLREKVSPSDNNSILMAKTGQILDTFDMPVTVDRRSISSGSDSTSRSYDIDSSSNTTHPDTEPSDDAEKISNGKVSPQGSSLVNRRPPGLLNRLRLFSLNHDRPRGHVDVTSAHLTYESLPDSNSSFYSSEFNHPGDLPKAKNLLSKRLAFTEKLILRDKQTRFHETSKDGQRPRTRWLSGLYHSSDYNSYSSNSNDYDLARSAPVHNFDSAGYALMEELVGAVNILSARKNQWCTISERSTIQVKKAAQSSKLVFIRKSIDEVSDDVYKRHDLHNFDEENAYSVFFKHSTCYDVLPESGKLLILDSNLKIRHAMQGLIDHSLTAAPVWSNHFQFYTHLLTQGLCLRLLAQVFPLNQSAASESSDSDLAADLNYWGGKTLASVLRRYTDWACRTSSGVEHENPVMVTPQHHLYRIAQLLTTGTVATIENASPVSMETPDSTSMQTDEDVFTFAEKTNVAKNLVVPPSRHILVADQTGSGNLLGIINSDRLLAYLRVRMRNLPTPSLLGMRVDELPGIRWEERGWQVDHENRASFPQHKATLNSFYLHPSKSCLEALHIMNVAWATAGLVCLPVATETGQGFMGMLAKIDILSYLFSCPVQVALSSTVGSIICLRPRPPGCSNLAMCFTSDRLMTVFDKLFHQKASCLAVFDKQASCASWDGEGTLGAAVGIITTTDLLHATILSPALHPKTTDNLNYSPDNTFWQQMSSPECIKPQLRVQFSLPIPSDVKSPISISVGPTKRNSLPLPNVINLQGRSTEKTNFCLTTMISPLSKHPIGRLFHRQKRSSESEDPVMQLEGPFTTHQTRRRFVVKEEIQTEFSPPDRSACGRLDSIDSSTMAASRLKAKKVSESRHHGVDEDMFDMDFS